MKFSSLITSYFSLFFQKLCPCCDNNFIGSDLLCLACHPPKLLNKNDDCDFLEVSLQKVPIVYLWEYSGLIKNLIHKMKFNKQPKIASYLADYLYLKIIEKNWKDLDFIFAIPCSKENISKRGFNQSSILAKSLCKKIPNLKFIYNALQVNNYLLKETSQKKLSRKQRIKKSKDKYTCKNLNLHGKNILLVDDIYTTGATLEAACNALFKLGVKKIYCLVLAKTPLKTSAYSNLESHASK